MGYIKATKRQRDTMKGILKGKSVSRAMREDGGYSKNTAVNPKVFTQSKGGKALLEKYFPDDFLFTEHAKNIKQDKDKGAKNKAIDMAYRLKGDKYPREDQEFEAGDLKIVIKKS